MDYSIQREMLIDDKSRIYYDARRQLLVNNSISEFYSQIKQAEVNYYLREVEEFKRKHGITAWIVYGEDDYARYNCMVMNDCGYKVSAVTFEGFVELFNYAVECLDIDSLETIICRYNVGLIVNKRDINRLPEKLLESDKVLIMFSHIVGRQGKQYFDYFDPVGLEIFLDAGCLDGATTEKFIAWCNGQYTKVYAFEPNPLMYEECRNNLLKYDEKVQLYKYALWDSKCKLSFASLGSKWDAKVSYNGDTVVSGNTIDNVLQGSEVTFMKFDIEGAEIQALKGAENTIVSHKPRMAISVYHNENDLFEIMEYLNLLVPEYKFALRHYHSDLIETVLYVFK